MGKLERQREECGCLVGGIPIYVPYIRLPIHPPFLGSMTSRAVSTPPAMSELWLCWNR
jgi:hypothetical protein